MLPVPACELLPCCEPPLCDWAPPELDAVPCEELCEPEGPLWPEGMPAELCCEPDELLEGLPGLLLLEEELELLLELDDCDGDDGIDGMEELEDDEEDGDEGMPGELEEELGEEELELEEEELDEELLEEEELDDELEEELLDELLVSQAHTTRPASAISKVLPRVFGFTILNVLNRGLTLGLNIVSSCPGRCVFTLESFVRIIFRCWS